MTVASLLRQVMNTQSYGPCLWQISRQPCTKSSPPSQPEFESTLYRCLSTNPLVVNEIIYLEFILYILLPEQTGMVKLLLFYKVVLVLVGLLYQCIFFGRAIFSELYKLGFSELGRVIFGICRCSQT